MRTVPMCLSILRVPRFGVPTLANMWSENVLNKNYGDCSWFNQFGFRICNLEGGRIKRWTKKSASTKAGGKTKTGEIGKLSDIRNEILEGSVSTSCTISSNKSEKSEFMKLQYCDIQQTVMDKKELARSMTVLIFDIETTGFSRERDRIIEIGIQDLNGGKYSTFQTLINPERYVPNAFVHKIESRMVNRPDVPRMKELIPILLEYVKSRQKSDGYVLLVAHNARCFDVPFLVNEFSRCSFDIPSNWRFLDTLPLCRELMKSLGLKTSASIPGLLEHYRIQPIGSAHRAMSDVSSLSFIFQRVTFDLRLTVLELLERSFTVSDLTMKKTKKKN